MTAKKDSKKRSGKTNYWDKREGLLYYYYVQALLNRLAVNMQSILDVGSADTPILEELDWIPKRFTVDKRNPYSSINVVGVKTDFFEYEPEERFDFVLCLQVLEHIPEASIFAKRLFDVGDHVLISVPYKWKAGASKYHIHDPVDLKKLKLWTGRKPSYHLIVREPYSKSSSKSKRLICYYHPEGRKVKVENLGIEGYMAKGNASDAFSHATYTVFNTLRRIKKKIYNN